MTPRQLQTPDRDWFIDIIRLPTTGHWFAVLETGTWQLEMVEIDDAQDPVAARLALLEIVRRWNRYPDCIVTDHSRALSGLGVRIGVDQRYLSVMRPSFIEHLVRGTSALSVANFRRSIEQLKAEDDQ